MPVAICTPLLSDAAALTPSTEAPALPATNLLRPDPFHGWRTLTAINSTLTIDLGATKPVRLIWLGYTNATATAIWAVLAANSVAELSSGPGYSSGNLSHWPTPNLDLMGWKRTHAYLWLPAPIAFRYWRISVADTGNPDGYYQAGRLYMANAWVPAKPPQMGEGSRGIDIGWSMAVKDASELERPIRGGAIVRPRGKWRELRLSLSFLAEDEMFENAHMIDRLRGASGDVLVLRDPENPRRHMDESIQGLMTSLQPIVSQTPPGLYRKSYVVEEYELP